MQAEIMKKSCYKRNDFQTFLLKSVTSLAQLVRSQTANQKFPDSVSDLVES